MLDLDRLLTVCSFLFLAVTAAHAAGGDAALGTQDYDKFKKSSFCAACHQDIAAQYEQSMMRQSFTHHWDEIEYFKLALPHALKEEKVAEVKAGCNGCHAPLAFLAGDIPPKPPEEGTRANEGVSCDLCHSMVGFEGEIPFNFNFIVEPGKVKQGMREDTEPKMHEVAVNPFLESSEMCGTCHNEKDPWGLWVKATHLEWKESPYASAGITCQDCHMPVAGGRNVKGGPEYPDVRQHLFHGAHDPGKLAGAVEVRIHAARTKISAGKEQRLMATVLNAKAGHMIPSGSAEERLVWLHVEAVDAAGKRHHLPVEAKGFEGEAYTIASDSTLAYQDIGEIMETAGFKGLKRDGQVPAGDRIFRLPYLDPQGRMTIAQWNTAAFGPDYRLRPLEAINETFRWKLPAGLPAGEVTVEASVYYALLPTSVAQHLGVPDEETEPRLMARHITKFEVTKR